MFAYLTAQTATGEAKNWKGHGELATAVLRSWEAKGYTNITDSRTAPAKVTPIATPVAKATEQTGRVGKGHQVHRIAAGSSVCGASFRRGFGTNRPVFVTGEAVTCKSCQH